MRAWSLEFFLARVVASINTRGWLAKYQAYRRHARHLATADTVLDALEGKRPGLMPTDADCEEALKVVQWASSVSPDSYYLELIRTLTRTGYVTRETAGVAASMVVAYRREFGVPTKKLFVTERGLETMPEKSLQPRV